MKDHVYVYSWVSCRVLWRQRPNVGWKTTQKTAVHSRWTKPHFGLNIFLKTKLYKPFWWTFHANFVGRRCSKAKNQMVAVGRISSWDCRCITGVPSRNVRDFCALDANIRRCAKFTDDASFAYHENIFSSRKQNVCQQYQKQFVKHYCFALFAVIS